jgi:hypothetical protein
MGIMGVCVTRHEIHATKGAAPDADATTCTADQRISSHDAVHDCGAAPSAPAVSGFQHSARRQAASLTLSRRDRSACMLSWAADP